MPVPSEVRYIENSATKTVADAEYSADGGTTFAPREALSVTDTSGVQRPAAADDITHVRWSMRDAIAPGQTGQLWYRATLE